MAKSNLMASNSPMLFELPASTTITQFLEGLEQLARIQVIAKTACQRSYLDSFDWRLYSNNLVAEWLVTGSLSTFNVSNLSTSQLIRYEKRSVLPRFADQFATEEMRTLLEPILEVRALLPICRIDYTVIPVNLVDDEGKTILRLHIESYQHFNNRLHIQAVKGYESAAKNFLTQLKATWPIQPVHDTLLISALKRLGRQPLDYTSKLCLHLTADEKAEQAAKSIYQELLKTLRRNEQGVIHDIDSGFLHDFRVAVRRTRAGLSQIKGVLPEAITTQYAAFFSWLGQITTPTRDLDVYLLNFPQYQSSLPYPLNENLAPLKDLLLTKQRLAQQTLARQLQSSNYLTTITEWENYLNQNQAHQSHTKLNIKQLADLRIWKIFQKVLAQGDSISDDSPWEALHELRKTCKKLRYLIEFFQSLYVEKKLKHVIQRLKTLQDVLGNIQDFHVQEESLKQFRQELALHALPVEHLTAIDALIHSLRLHKDQARQAFAAHYRQFRNVDNQAAFKELFAP